MTERKLAATVRDAFRRKWGTEPTVIARAPGRVNLIGEHTDYTGGYVLPVAIDREIVMAAAPSSEPAIEGWSVDFEGMARSPLGDYDPHHPAGWFRYVLGVVNETEREGHPIGGFRFAVGGDVPIGAGLSSSAALETAVLTALEGLFGYKVPDVEAALLCQRAENNFVGMNSGIMDQFISRMGRRGKALFINCADLSHRTVPINLPGWIWLVIDSRKRRELVGSAYNDRRRECEEGVNIARTVFPDRGITDLKDLRPDDLDEFVMACPDTIFRRVRHVVTENARVLDTVEALARGDVGAVGENLTASHVSLRDDFEVSCAELDLLVDVLEDVDGVAGARLTGAGFGGCVVALAAVDAVPEVEKAVRGRYRPAILGADDHAPVWPVTVADGAGLLT